MSTEACTLGDSYHATHFEANTESYDSLLRLHKQHTLTVRVTELTKSLNRLKFSN